MFVRGKYQALRVNKCSSYCPCLSVSLSSVLDAKREESWGTLPCALHLVDWSHHSNICGMNERRKILLTLPGRKWDWGRTWVNELNLSGWRPRHVRSQLGQKPGVEVGMAWTGTVCRPAQQQRALSGAAAVPNHRTEAEGQAEGGLVRETEKEEASRDPRNK